VPYLPDNESSVIPHRNDHPAREQFMTQVLTHGLPGLEGQEAYMRRYTGLGTDHIWEDLEREYGDLGHEAGRLQRRNAFRVPRNRWRHALARPVTTRMTGPVAGPVASRPAIAGPSSRAGPMANSAATIRVVEEPASNAGSVADRRIDSVQPKVVSQVPNIRVPFEDIVESEVDQAEMTNWSDDCRADPRDGPRVQQVASKESPTFVRLERVQSHRAVFEHADDAQEDSSAEEDVDEDPDEGADEDFNREVDEKADEDFDGEADKEADADADPSPGCDACSNQGTVDDKSRPGTPNWTFADEEVSANNYALSPQKSERAWWAPRPAAQQHPDFHWTVGQY